MSSTNEALMRLLQHAGLPETGKDMPTDTLAEFIFQVQRGGCCPDLQIIIADVIDCLDSLNRQLNYDVVAEESQRRSIDRQVVYAASGMVLACLDSALAIRRADPQSAMAIKLLGAAWRIQCAWEALVAGDIENLVTHVAAEQEVRFGKGSI